MSQIPHQRRYSNSEVAIMSHATLKAHDRRISSLEKGKDEAILALTQRVEELEIMLRKILDAMSAPKRGPGRPRKIS